MTVYPRIHYLHTDFSTCNNTRFLFGYFYFYLLLLYKIIKDGHISEAQLSNTLNLLLFNETV